MDNCKITEKGTEYRGTINVTLTGKSCQNWNHQFPHKHNFTSLSSEANYCRNPNDAEMPWCYTLHKARIWEYCHIPDCYPLHCKNTDNGIDYRGNVNITVSGKSCQKWKSETPHRHGYVDMLGNDENYCRTPDQGNSKPWCYTIDPSTRWEYCFVPTCENCLRLLNGRNFDGSWKKTASGKTCVKWKSVESLPANISFLKNHENYCRNPDNSAKPWCYVDLKGTKEFCKIPLCNECLTSNNGIHYEGEKEITKSGKLCEMWKKYIAEGDKMDYLRHQKNYCRNPNNEQSPWCYIAIDNIGGNVTEQWEYCDIPKCRVLNCLQTITDISYAGTTSITETGKQCQNWNSQKPHRHPFTYLDRNFCRTLGYGGESRPRCLTTDPNVLWEYCYIPLCGTPNCRLTEKGTEYQGLLGETEHGHVCQMWSDQLPHPHIYTRLSNQKNFCRNPDHSERPWCYTTNPCIEREYCNIPMCDKEECIRDEGIDYLGRKNITKNGRTCQRWDTQSPHVHYFSHLREHENYCRNPSGSPKPWCYTTDPTMRWNYCDLPECSSGECRRTVSGVDYKGKVKVTENGLLCQRWDSQIPHSHNFESLSSEQNYCRNPNGKPRQWCFTTSSSVEFEYCTVPPCFPEECSKGWYRFGSSCLFVLNGTVGITSFDAQKECETKGGNLVSINSQSKMEAVQYLMRVVFSIKEAHIGLRKVTGNGTYADYQWTDGSPLTYTAWKSDKKNVQPNGLIDERCTAIELSGDDINTWHDIPCLKKDINNIICENKEYVNVTGLKYLQTKVQETERKHQLKNVYICDNEEFISRLYLCNGIADCGDGSDEKSCGNASLDSLDNEVNGTRITLYQCDDGSFVPLIVYCDGYDDCPDKSDESRCRTKDSCNSTEWRCENGHCIAKTGRCDGKVDCSDLSDEKDCQGSECHDGLEYCYDLKCIPSSRVCDNFYDCRGNYHEDEDQIRCGFEPVFSCGAWLKRSNVQNGTYKIGLGFEKSIDVDCKFYGTKATTIIRSLNDNWLTVKENGVAISREITYDVSKMVISKLKQVSNCSQHIIVECGSGNVQWNSSIFFENTLNEHFSLSGKYSNCNCFLDSVCKINKTSRCNCEGYIGSSTDVDQGEITDKRYVPIVRVSAVNSTATNSDLRVHVQDVKCVEDIKKQSINLNCKNGQLYLMHFHCLLRIDTHGDVIGCRDLSHLQGCSDYNCPADYLKCHDSYCIHMSLLCDGVNHCPNGEDEIDCVGLQCPGSFKCHSYEKQSICIPINSVCDGIRDCPLGDDERLCNVTCPNGCLCSDLDFTCNRVVNLAELDLRVNRLDFSHQFWPWDGRVFRSLLFLGELVLKDTSLTEVFRGMFENLINLYFLDLRDNAIKTIQSHAFKGLKYLQILLLKGNPLLQTISESSFDGLSSLVSLDLSRKNINDFPNDAFKGLVALKFLNLSYNKIHEFNTDISKGLDRLEILDIRQSGIPPKASMFDSLTSLETLYTDFYVFCCLKPPGVSRNRCFPPEDEFSSCKYLMKYSVLRVFIWIIGMAALLGNILVIIVRVIIDRSNIVKRSFPIWVSNLSVSDLLMGIYLTIIGIVDMIYKGTYAVSAENWKNSIGCKTAGVLSVMSSEASVLFIFLITIDRLLVVKFPFGNFRFSPRVTFFCCFIVWCIAASLALILILVFDENFYSKSGVCLALPLVKADSTKALYSVSVFIFFNFVVFMAIAVGQLIIYLEIRKVASGSILQLGSRQKKEAAVARSLFMVVLTDFLCWFPVGIMGIMAMSGHQISADVYVWVTVFVIPINSALNPFLYTFSSILKRKRFQTEATTDRRMSARYTTEFGKTNTLINICEGKTICFGKRDDDYPLSKYLMQKSLTPQVSDIYLIATKLASALQLLHEIPVTHGAVSSQTVLVYLQKEGTVKNVQLQIVRKEQKQNENDDFEPYKDIGDFGLLMRLILRRREELKKSS